MEEGILKNGSSIIPFDGIHKSRNPEANKDLALEFAFQRNIDWAFLYLRKQIGTTKLQNWLTKLNFGNSAKFWLGLQDDFDIEEEMSTKSRALKSIKALNIKVA